MGFLNDIAKIALPAVAGSFLGPAAGGLFSGATGIMANPAVQNALLSGGIGLLTGQKPKDALKSALLGGIGQTMFGQAGQAAGADGQNLARMTAGMSPGESMARFGNTQAAGTGSKFTAPAGTGTSAPTEAVKPQTMSAELLKGLGMADDNMLYKILNTQLGEGAAAGLLAQILAGDEKEDTRTSWEKRPYAGGMQYGKLGGINYNQGGLAQYPRRDGGIDPNEGSGTKDDVPAMLTAGEFVMTRDAVQGAGGGDLRQGINRMYNMMDKFERMA